MHAAITETEAPKWWERYAGPNILDIHSTEEFSNALSQAGDKLVIVEFYGTWGASCKALFPKLCRAARDHPEILFLKVNFDKNKPMCKELNVKVLPQFHFYRGAGLSRFPVHLPSFRKYEMQLNYTTQLGEGLAPIRASKISSQGVVPLKEKQADLSGL